MSKYIVYLEPAEEGGIIVTCPHFPGCVTQGETAKEAVEMVKDAIVGYIASLKKNGDPIPPGIGGIIEKIEVIEVLEV